MSVCLEFTQIHVILEIFQCYPSLVIKNFLLFVWLLRSDSAIHLEEANLQEQTRCWPKVSAIPHSNSNRKGKFDTVDMDTCGGEGCKGTVKG